MTFPASKGEILTNEACKTCSIRSVALFKDLEPDVFDRFHASIRDIQIDKGENLYTLGQTGERVFTIRQGIVKLVQYLPDGAQRIVRLVKTTDITGLEALLGQSYEHNAIVMQTSELCCLPVATVKELTGLLAPPAKKK